MFRPAPLFFVVEDAVKRYVIPALKVLIAVVIAVALAKIAFFPDQGDSATADITPGYQLSTKTTTVTVGDISSTVEVKGKIVQDKAVEAKKYADMLANGLAENVPNSCGVILAVDRKSVV